MTEKEDTVVRFIRTFLEIHIYSAVGAFITAKRLNVLAGLGFYLGAVHVLAAMVFLFNIHSTSLTHAVVHGGLNHLSGYFDPSTLDPSTLDPTSIDPTAEN
ncbi:MAG: hypothetical protein ABEJ99_03385 [Candidatus Nanohaloarchaea archaeon]